MPGRLALDENGNPLLDQFSLRGFVICVFRIAELERSPERYSLRLVASHRGELVGFRAVVRRNIGGIFTAGLNLIPPNLYGPAVEFMRTGPESDAMIGALRGLFGMPSREVRMADITPFTGIALSLDEPDMELRALKIKLHPLDYEDVNPNTDFECFFTVDLPSRLVFWSEKDDYYRRALVQAVSTPEAAS
jgi:hypothetical protein